MSDPFIMPQIKELHGCSLLNESILFTDSSPDIFQPVRTPRLTQPRDSKFFYVVIDIFVFCPNF